MARAVRIGRGSAAARARAEEDRSPGAPDPEKYRPNVAGLTRSYRLFAIYAVALAFVYVIFLGLSLTSPDPGVSQDRQALGGLTAVAAVLVIGGFFLTLGRTPRAMVVEEDRYIITEFLGSRRTFPRDGSVEVHVANRFAPGPLAPEPTQMVELHAPGGPTRTYLVGRKWLPDARGKPDVPDG